MNRLLKILTRAGVSDEQPEYLQRRVFLSNCIALAICFFVAIPFTFISLIYFKPLVIIPVIGVIAILSCLLFNSMQLTGLGRSMIAYVPLVLAAMYNASLAMVGEPPVAGIYMIELSFSLIPFLIFDPREKVFLYISGGFVLLVVLSFRLLNAWVEIDLDTEIIRTGFLSDVSVFVSIAAGLGSVIMLVRQNRLFEEKSELLLTEANESQQQAAESEQAMKGNLEQLQTAQEEERQRQWVNEGLTQVAQLVRTHEDLSELADKLLSHIVKYTESNQGGLFIVNRDEDKEVLDLLAMYAYERKKHQNMRIEVGQGLIGQVYLEKEYMYFEKVPSHYVNITSGLGEAPPTSLIIMPLQVNGEVEGLLELASFRLFPSHEIDFLEKLGESVAAAMRNARINKKTHSLLAETQQQAEEMRATEEEMRQNMEELSATQEEMQRKEQEYLKRIADLDQQLASYGR